jgi:hypothetical protein
MASDSLGTVNGSCPTAFTEIRRRKTLIRIIGRFDRVLPFAVIEPFLIIGSFAK